MEPWNNPIRDGRRECVQKGARGILRTLLFVLGCLVLISILSATMILAWTHHVNTPSPSFPQNQPFAIEHGLSADAVAAKLEAQGVVRSALYVRLLMRTSLTDQHIRSGSHTFEEPLTTREVLAALISGSAYTPLTSATFPEGFRISKILDYLPAQFQNEDVAPFLIYEGYLFPDTYSIGTIETLAEVVSMMRGHFDDTITSLESAISESPFTLEEVIVLASILEREANDDTSMKLVSGILQNRLKEHMPLQVDATFDYMLGKASDELTLEDLAIDSPFNTYLYRGLPPAPIANPGLMAIRAVLEPTASSYFYYLTDQKGNFHYAETHDEHTANKARYLR